jgi:isoquinoline 1-oxidoreductase beta subunit
MANAVSRRAVFGGAAATALVVPFAVSFVNRHTQLMSPAGAPVGTRLGAYLQIDNLNNVTLFIGSTEMGQGIMTGMAQLVAEELQLNWAKVSVQHALASAANPNPYGNPLFYAQVTGGSTSMRGWYLPMRQAAAIARDMLLAAAEKLTPGGGWKLEYGGRITNGTKTYHLSDLVATAATLTPPTTATLATTRHFIGKPMTRVDLQAKVTGQAIYGIDVQVPNMLYASVVHCPTLGGTVSAIPAKPSGAVAIVNLGDAVGVVANDTYTAMSMASSLASRVTWKLPTSLASRDSASILATGQSLATSTTATAHVYESAGGDPAAVLATAKTKIDATYNLPYLAHACMEVLSCTASVTPTSCEVWAPTQAQAFALPTVMAITGLPASAVTIHTTFLGGGYGRKLEVDFITQAVAISKAVGKPVKLVWSRKQDMQNDKFRPCATIRVQAAVDATHHMSALLYRNVSPSINIQRNTQPGNNPEDTGAVSGALGLPYAIANKRIEFVPNPADVPLGYWRSVGESYNTFAVESAIDELATAAGLDPMVFRKRLAAADARTLGVLQALDTLCGWSTTTAPAGTARGMAFLSGFGSYIALAAQVTSRSGKVGVQKIYVAIDCGIAVNPDSIEAQLQGGIIHGLSATLWGEVTFASGVPNVVNFSNYRVARLSDAPEISVAIVPSTAAPGGVGETGVPCVAPAIANAWAKLTGTRVRTLPFFPGATMSDG